MTSPGASFSAKDNPAEGRFEMWVDGHMAFVRYRPVGDALAITYTEVPEELKGRGVGSRLMRDVLDQLRARGSKVISACSFASSYIDRHPEYSDMLVTDRDDPIDDRGEG